MKKYIGIINKKQIISVYADTPEEAKRKITILLRGRPGIDYYTPWVDGGCVVQHKEN